MSQVPVRVAPSPSIEKGNSGSAERSAPRSFHAVSLDARWRSAVALTNAGMTPFCALVPGASGATLLALFVDPASNVPLNPSAQLAAPQFFATMPDPPEKPIAQPYAVQL